MSPTLKVDVVGVGLNGAIDWMLVSAATAIFVYFAATARLPQLQLNRPSALILSAATLTLLLIRGTTLHRTTQFH